MTNQDDLEAMWSNVGKVFVQRGFIPRGPFTARTLCEGTGLYPASLGPTLGKLRRWGFATPTWLGRKEATQWTLTPEGYAHAQRVFPHLTSPEPVVPVRKAKRRTFAWLLDEVEALAKERGPGWNGVFCAQDLDCQHPGRAVGYGVFRLARATVAQLDDVPHADCVHYVLRADVGMETTAPVWTPQDFARSVPQEIRDEVIRVARDERAGDNAVPRLTTPTHASTMAEARAMNLIRRKRREEGSGHALTDLGRVCVGMWLGEWGCEAVKVTPGTEPEPTPAPTPEPEPAPAPAPKPQPLVLNMRDPEVVRAMAVALADLPLKDGPARAQVSNVIELLQSTVEVLEWVHSGPQEAR